MLNIKAFVNASTLELEEIMDCNVNKNTQRCFNIEAIKCLDQDDAGEKDHHYE